MTKPIIGLVSFTDPRPTSLASEREQYIEAQHNDVKTYLESQGMTVLDPGSQIREAGADIFGIRTLTEVRECVQHLRSAGAQAVVIGCWHWTEPGLTNVLVRDLGLPACLYIERNTGWAGACCQASSGSSLWEMANNDDAALRHERIRGDLPELAKWCRGVSALQRLKAKSLLLWGGSYSLRMEHLRDDAAMLKTIFVSDILEEDEYYLIKRAQAIAADDPTRIDRFVTWLRDGGVEIVYDDVMLNDDILRKQVALYLAARMRLAEIEDLDVVGVSVKCQNCLSEEYGITGCFLPAFLPFPVDAEGPQPIVSTTCEGDLKSLLTCALLNMIDPVVPPLFGDFKFAGDDYFLISNCGAASVYYAANSTDPKKVLPNIRIHGQCHCAAGGAVGWDGLPGVYTLARLVRVKGRYFMQLGLAEARELTDEIKSNVIFGNMWPHHAFSFGVSTDRLVKVLGGNHFCGLPGDVSAEMQFACRQAGIPVVRLDDEHAIEAFYNLVPTL